MNKRKIIFTTYPFPFKPLDYKYFSFPQEPISIYLGHEIHLSRIMLLKMLMKKQVTTDDVIVTSKDRKFLYTKIFKTVIDYDDLKQRELEFKDLERLFLTYYASVPRNDPFVKRYFIEEEDPELVRLATHEIDYIQDLKSCKPFVLIHLKKNEVFDRSVNIHFNNIIKDLLDVIPDKIDILIFCSIELEKILLNSGITRTLFFIRELRLYASLMRLKECKCIIGPMSGGTELSYYCSNTAPAIVFFTEEYYDRLLCLDGYIIESKHFFFTNLSGIRVFLFQGFKYMLDAIRESKLDLENLRLINNKISIMLNNIPFFPNDFDWKIYITLNPDLKLKNHVDAYRHYITIGYEKGLRYK